MDFTSLRIPLTIFVFFVILGVVVFVLKRRAKARLRGPARFSDEQCQRHDEAKKEALQRILGPMHNLVGHAIIPFHVGGAVDMYYFPNGIPGTGFATMELIEPDGGGPKPNRIGTYELVAFTRQRMPSSQQESPDHPFHKIERRMCGTLTTIGYYSYDAVLNPGDTCEVPIGEGEPNRCLILDEYKPDGIGFDIAGKSHCLLLCLEVFPGEMRCAMENGSANVLAKLKEEGHYPYSDLDRDSVV